MLRWAPDSECWSARQWAPLSACGSERTTACLSSAAAWWAPQLAAQSGLLSAGMSVGGMESRSARSSVAQLGR